ncbi:MAG: GNAT family N-acetyltransferase, partial [Rubrivivax sp.]|nr:GNAT family N-acetyltransferase [Rubrivivax sp.]
TPADAALEAEFVRNLSMEARYKRFMSSLRELAPAKLKYFTEVDQVRHLALVATAVERRRRTIVGVVRCVAPPGSTGCEYAIVVADRWQRTGLGSVLMVELMRAARERGLREIHGVVLAGNRGMLRLARQLGFQVQPQADEPGTVRVARAL